ncbi:DUF7927 domain-containing protein [Salininema proteolyticum]|uniref:Internalin n=1 Tax=Salininema proteolyticum TaxID=1607685 RepID=A0ABV8TWU5_9ACTN
MSDDLTGVIDDATFNADASADAGTVSYAEPVLTWTGDIAVGATVTITYSVTVDDPPAGDHSLDNAVTGPPGSTCEEGSDDPDCSSEVPVKALEIAKVAATTSASAGDTVTYTVTATNTGQVDFTGETITDDLTGVIDDATFNDDASADAGTVSYAEPTLTWTGDIAVGSTVTITYTVTVDDPPTGDDSLDNMVVGPPGSTCEPGSDDPACTTTVPLGELDILKSSSAADDPVVPGSTIEYTVTVTNSGGLDYEGAEVTDDLTEVVDDATFNDDASADAGTVSYTEPTLTWTGDIAIGETVTITYTVTVNDPLEGDGSAVNSVTGPPGSNCPPGSTDPDCTTTEEIAALDIAKSADTETANAGDTVNYTVTIANTGAADYEGAEVTDDLTGVVDDATFNDDASADSGTVSYAEPILTWTGDVAAGATVTITYSVTVTSPIEGDANLANTVTGPPGSTCEPDSDDPDCTTNVPLADLEIEKQADTAEAMPGDTVAYTITVTNPGQADYTGAEFTDDMSGVVDDATFNDDASADSGTVVFAEPVLTWTGDVAAGQTVTITYTVTVNDPVSGDGNLANVVTGPPGTPCEPGSDDPACSPEVPVKALDIVKSSDATTAKPGEDVAYTVTITNTGTVAYTGTTVTDDMSGVVDDATFNDDASADSGEVSYTEPTLTWTGDVPVGGTVVITYTVTVNDPISGDGELGNVVTGPPGSPCEEGSDDPACQPEVPLAALEIEKTADKSTVIPGEDVAYTVTITNPGQADFTGAEVTDDLTEVIDDAAYNDDASADAGAIAYAEPVLTWTGDVAVGATVTITYTVTVDSPITGDSELDNTVTGPPGSNCPDGSTDPRCTTNIGAASLEIAKVPGSESTVAGATVEYTITVTNTGSADYPDAEVTDDLTEVIDDAVFNDDAMADSGEIAYAEPILTWTGEVAEGQTVTITYSVTVSEPVEGDHNLVNMVTGPPGSTCEPGSDDPACSPEVPVGEVVIDKSNDAPSDDELIPGSTVAYTVTMENVGQLDYTDEEATDDLSGVVDDATYNDDASADSGTVAYSEPTLTWTGDLAIGQTVTITYSVTVNDPISGDKVLRNAFTGIPGSRCGDDPTDTCEHQTPAAELEIVKSSDKTTTGPGEDVSYTVAVTNIGTGPYTDAVVTDDLTGVLDDGNYNDDAAADSGTVSYAEPVITWEGDIDPGQTVTIAYTVTAGDPFPAGDGEMLNVVTGPPGSNCEPGEDAEGCSTLVQKLAHDFGDAPDSFGTTLENDGAHHQITETLGIGEDLHADEDGTPHGTAAAHADDDGIAGVRGLELGSTEVSLDIQATNDGSDDAVLAVWTDVDMDGDHVGDDHLFEQVDVPAGSGTQVYTVTFATEPLVEGEYHARLRLFGIAESPEQGDGEQPESAEEAASVLVNDDPIEEQDSGVHPPSDRLYDITPTGFGGAGEIEDHYHTLGAAPGEEPEPMPVTGASLSGLVVLGAATLLGGLLIIAALAWTRRREENSANE